MGDLCQTFDVYHIRVGVTQSLDVESLGVLLKACFDLIIIGRSHESGGHTVVHQSMRQQIVGAAVNIICRNDMISLFCQVLDRVADSCCATGYRQSCGTTFQCCNTLLEDALCRVAQTTVDLTGIFQSETGCCVIAVAEYIRRCLINGNGSGTGHRIGLLLSHM